ncbi:MAG: hypothetical protein E7552_03870 [Ruminococcaceae bacterium]|nr:hypothetical protein [Oscillospiraceae bacterium]
MSDTVTYTLTEAELFSALWHTRRSNGRLIVQTVLLLVLGVPALVGVLGGKRDAATLLCGTVLPLLAVLQWVWPWAEFRREARMSAAQNTPLTLTFTAETLTVANETVAWQNAVLRRVNDCVLWRVDGQWIVIPRRAVSDALWETLLKEAEA